MAIKQWFIRDTTVSETNEPGVKMFQHKSKLLLDECVTPRRRAKG